MLLLVEPVYQRPGYFLTSQEIQITNTLFQLILNVTGNKKYVRLQVAAAQSLGKQPITLFTGNQIDHMFKVHARTFRTNGILPPELQIAKPGFSPDLFLGNIGWDVTTGEQGRHHYNRDVRLSSRQWDAYFVLGY